MKTPHGRFRVSFQSVGLLRSAALSILAFLAAAAPAAATIQMAQATADAWEGQGSLTICLTRTPPIEPQPAEYYAIAVAGTATSPADFVMTWVNIYTPWPDGQPSVTLTLDIANDGVPEGYETFSVVMTARAGATDITGSPFTMVITIHDGNGGPGNGCGGGPTPTPSPTSTPPPPTPTPTITPTPVPTPVGTPSLPIMALVPNSGPSSGGTT
ncbi:MAG TPA: hypothetical protein VIB08_11030, partial [Thermoanaerobaculia bacterium]